MNYPELDLLILKAISTDKQAALDFVGGNSVYLFDNSLWNIANLVINYIKTYKDVPTLNVLKDRLGKTAPAMIDSLLNVWQKMEGVVYNEKEYKHNIEVLHSRFRTAEIVKLKEKLDHSELNSSNLERTILEIKQTLQTVNQVSQTKTYERKTLKESIGTFRDEVAAKLSDPNFDRGIPTHYSFLDEATDGLRGGELLVVAGESNSGKSMLLLNIAKQMWMQQNKIDMVDGFHKGHNVLYFSLEMPFKPCRNRIYSCLSGVPTKLIKRPVSKDGRSRLNADDRQKLKTTLQFIDKYPYQFEIVDIPRGATMEAIETIFEDAKTKYNPDVVAIDYLGLMDDDSKEDDWLKLGIIAGKIHEFCRVKNVIGLTAVQLNRTKAGSKDADERIGMHRIGRSALILTHADLCIQIETRSNEQNYPDMLCHLIKVRDGERGKGRLIKNLGCGSLLNEETNEGIISNFSNYDDLSEKIDFFDI